VKECVKGTKEDSKIVMAGFSQGALMTRAAIKKLPAEVMKKVSAVVLWGDPGMSQRRVASKLYIANNVQQNVPIPRSSRLFLLPTAPAFQVQETKSRLSVTLWTRSATILM